MRRALPLLLLPVIAGACDRLGGRGGDDGSGAGDPLANLQVTDRNADPARLQALIDRAMPAVLGAAKEPRYSNVRAGAGGAVCGEVSAAGEPARPFIVTPDAVAVVAAQPRLDYADPSDFTADAYVRWCATPEELKAIQVEIRRAAADPANLAMPAAANAAGASVVTAAEPPPPPPTVEPVPAPPPAKPPGARSPAPAPAGDIDSFANAVRR
jgi:hypothetical protein